MTFELSFRLVDKSDSAVEAYVGGSFIRGWSYAGAINHGYREQVGTHKNVVYLTAPPALGGGSGDIIGLRIKVRRSNGSASIGDWIEIDDISIRALPGVVAWQINSAPRPTLQQDGNGRFYLAYDGVDDIHNAPLRFNGMPPGLVAAAAAYDGAAQLLRDDTGNAFLARAEAASGLSPSAVMTGGTLSVNGGGAITTRDALASAMPSMTPRVITQAGWDAITVGWNDSRIGYVAGYGNLRRLYGMIVRGAATSADDVQRAREWLAAKAGVTL